MSADPIRPDPAARRALLAPGPPAGVTEAMIDQLVRTFYGRVREDEVLGPIFNARVDDWEHHMARIADFWSSVLMMSGRFKGSPMQAHARIAEIQTAHFDRWLDIWRGAAREIAPPAAADLFIAKAELIGESLRLGIAAASGELPPLKG